MTALYPPYRSAFGLALEGGTLAPAIQLTVIDETADLARAAGELQDDLHRRGEPLASRDAFIAGSARGLGERLVVTDSDFDVEGITDVLEVDFL